MFGFRKFMNVTNPFCNLVIYASLLTSIVVTPTMTTANVDEVTVPTPLASSSATDNRLQLFPMQQLASHSTTSLQHKR